MRDEQAAVMQGKVAGGGLPELVAQAIATDPRVGLFLQEVVNTSDEDGRGVLHAMMAVFGTDVVDALDDEVVLTEIAERSQREIAERLFVEQSRERQAQNWAESMEAIETFGNAYGVDEEAMATLLNIMFDTAEAILLSKIDAKVLQLFYKAVLYDNDVLEAEQRGEVRGRNQKIALNRRAEQSEKGLPWLNSRGVDPTKGKGKASSLRSKLELGNYKPAKRFMPE